MSTARFGLRIVTALAGFTLFAAAPAFAQNGGSTPLTRLRFDIVGIRLVVDPPVLTVPKNIPTVINTSLALPPSATSDVRDALNALTAGAVVEATLRGPSLPPTRITVPAGQPIPIPALALAGDYFLDGIRLVRNGETILDATAADGRPATTIPIRVINEVFVTNVTSRPLSLEEIRERGIVIDQSSFQAVNFQVAFNIDGQPFTIDMPSILPTLQLLQTTADRTSIIRQVAAMNQALAAAQTRLPPEFDRPGINFSIAALPFMFVPEDGEVPSLDIPPVNGLVIIAGNVAFLNQFFKVAVLVANVAPGGSLLSLRDVTGSVTLPRGLDGVSGTTEAPGDDPLRLARLDGLGVQPTTPIMLPGSDGVAGTADDIPVIAPQQQGEGELLLEGLKEGGHTFDVAIGATLDGLPSGPVRMTGMAAGAVFVRNPTFAVTLAHPRTIRSGETYDLYATVTNTSRSVANLVSVNLDPLSISGAQLLSDPTISFETLPAGESAVARFTLRAQLTGEVTYSSFTGEASNGGAIRLFTGIGERDVPLAPNSIVLPSTTNALPPSLVAAAQRVLGQAFSIASAPPEAIPPDVRFVRRQTVIDRGIELAQAGERVQFGEPLGRVILDLLLDWTGNGGFDSGFDDLMRTTQAGAAFLAEIAAVMGPDAATGVLAYQRAFAGATATRALPHVSAFAAGTGTPAPTITITRADGTTVRPGEPGVVTAPGGAALELATASASTNAATLARAEPVRHVFEFTASSTGLFDLGIVIPGSTTGTLLQLQYAGIALSTGGVARVELDLGSPAPEVLQIDADGNGATDSTANASIQTIEDQPPAVLHVQQLESSIRERPGDPEDPATYGLLVAVLFDKPVTPESAELRANYTLERNEVIGARLQTGGRLVYLYLRQPIGGLTARSLTIAGIQDLRGRSLAAVSSPIASNLTDGGRVFGQVREAGGQPVPDTILRLTVVFENQVSFDVATIRVDQNGSFDFEFVPRLGLHFVLTAQHPITRDITTLTARFRGTAEQLLLNPTFTGRGSVRGRLIAPDGVTPVPNVPVALIPGAVLGNRGFQGRTNTLGEFIFTDMPVGVFTLSSADGVRGFAQVQGLLAHAGQDLVQDLVLVEQPTGGGRVGGRVFLADGSTPGRGFTVYVGQYDRSGGSISAVDSTTTDDTGSFVFGRTLPPAGYDVVAVDPGSQQLGATSTTVSAGLTSSVSIVLEASGSVEGVVFNAQGQPVAGAVIAGGAALVTADGNGFFRIDGVPAGARTIEAGDPATRRRGSARVTVSPGQLARVSVTLEARATITGRVLDANGNPMPRVSVRLPVLGGYSFVFTNNQGVYTFPDLALGSHLIQAPGPSVDSLIAYLEANGYDPAASFTSGDAPAGSASPPVSSDQNAVLAAYERAVQSFVSADESILGLPMAAVGGFGWNKVELFQDSTTVVADIRFLAQGEISGRTEDSAGRPTGAVVRVTGLSVGLAGHPTLAELGRTNTDAATGAFVFTGIPRFDLATFQSAGVRSDFTLESAQPFSPAIISHRGQLNTSTPNLSGIVLRFPAASDTNGTISGQILLPDGTPAPANTQVQINFGDLTVLTGPDGRFASLLPIPGGTYIVTATAPNGLRGRTAAAVPAGGNVDVQLRLLGLGSTTIVVRRPNGAPVTNAFVQLERGSFPNDRADGRTDASGVVHFVNITEGPVSVVAEEEGTGLNGRASGVVSRSTDVTIPVVIRAAGIVRGTFRTADGLVPIPGAQIIVSSGGTQAFATTDTAGRFELHAVPVGPLTVDASDPVTGRAGRANAELSFEGQLVDVTVLQLPRGTVSGVVFNADGVTPVPAARVRIVGQGISRLDLQATARADGGFRFEGIPQGSFTIEAVDPVSGFEGETAGRIDLEGALVDAYVTLEPFGAIDVVVRDHTGTIAANANVTIAGPGGTRTGVVGADGAVSFEHLRLGTYRLTARSLADPGSGGEGQAVIAAANDRVAATITLRGSGSVTVGVIAADGVTPVASAQVTLQASAALTDNTVGVAASTFTGFTDGSGQVTFTNVPVGNVFARGEAAALAGVATTVVSAPGSVVPLTVQLGASGAVTGRILLPDGVTPAVQAIVTLRFQPQSQLQSGTLQITTGVDGTFGFSGIPLGTFTLSALEIMTSGVRNASGSLTSNGQVATLGDLALDNAGPRVTSTSPADRASGIAPDTAFRITFSEPIDPSTIRAGDMATANITLRHGTTRIAVATPTFEDSNRILVLQPLQPLGSGASISMAVTAGPDGPADTAGFSLLEPFVATFTSRDVTPPLIVSVSPAAGSQGIGPEASVRVAFSEPVANANLTLTTAGGAAVPGTTALAAGNTVLVFAPQTLLQPNTSYTVTVGGVSDTAGNGLAGGTAAFGFATVDTLAPVITALQVGGVARAGSPLQVQAIVGAADTARVEFRTSSGFVTTALAAPFTAAVPLPIDAASTTITAVAFDHVGNRSSAFEQTITVQPDASPTVTLTNLSGSVQVRQGETLTFQVTAADDGALARVLFSAVGAANISTVQNVSGSQTTFTTTFNVQVPASAVSGQGLTVQAASIDSLGQQSDPASLAFTVLDGVRPALTVLSPVNDAQVLSGQSVSVTVDATDDTGVASVTLVCNPSLVGCEQRVLPSPLPGTRQTFTIQVPDTLQAPTVIALVIRATDTAGNSIEVGRTLRLTDGLAPVVTSLAKVSGSTQVLAGEQVALRAGVSDNVGVTAVTFEVTGAVGMTANVPVTPPVTAGQIPFGFSVPESAPNGTIITVVARARDAAGNVSAESTLVLTVGDTAGPTIELLAPPAGTAVNPGTRVTMRIRATDDVGVARVVFEATGILTAATDVVLAVPLATTEATFDVDVPANAAAGAITLTARAVDTAANSSAVVSRVVTVNDVVAPNVQIVAPAQGSSVDPRTPLSVVVDASDTLGVTQVTVTVTGSANASETRAITATPTTQQAFQVPFSPLPARGGSVTITASARDAAGNVSAVASTTAPVLDVVAPTVAAFDPADGATAIDRAVNPTVRFSEPVAAATLANGVLLRQGGTPVPATVTADAAGELVTLTPASALAANTLYTILVTTAVTDAAGNTIVVERTASFRTASNDVEGPQVVSVAPPDGGTNVALSAPVEVTFNETIDPATVTPTSFRVEIDGQPVAGLRTFIDTNRGIRFQPAEPWTAGATVTVTLATSVADLSGNTLADATGAPLTAPVVTTFTTTSFGITSPAGTSVVEETHVLLEARASNTAGISSVVFTVNGTEQPPAPAPAFSRPFVVPSAATTSTLTIRASARNAQGAEVASDERTFEVVVGLRVTPTLAGVPIGGSTGLRFTLSSALTTDLPIELRAGNTSLVTFPLNPVVLPAGATEVTAMVVGEATGNTAVFGESARGTASAVVSVSPRVDGQTLTPSSQLVGVSISNPPSAGLVVLGIATTDTSRLRLLSEAATIDQAVSILSTNAAVATATAGPLLAGQLAADVTITTGAQGVATLIIRVGDVVRSVTVIVGTPPAGSLPLILASPAGVAISNPPNVGQLVVTPGTNASFTTVILSSAAGADTPVIVESSNPAIATATANTIAAGGLSTTLSVNAISNGVVTLIIRAGGDVRAVTLYVGTPPAGQQPILLAPPVGVAISNPPTIGQLVTASGAASATELVLLTAPASGSMDVSVTSSDPAIATAAADPIAAGSRSTILRITTAADGIARLTLRAGTETWTVTVFVGNVPIERRPVLVASPVGASIAALSQLGTVVAQPGTPIVSSLGIQLFAAPRLSALTVSAQSSDAAIATVNGAATTSAELSAGQAVLGLTIATTGLEGTAVITFEFDGQRRQLLVVVGNPPASQRPAIVAPVLGVRIGG